MILNPRSVSATIPVWSCGLGGVCSNAGHPNGASCCARARQRCRKQRAGPLWFYSVYKSILHVIISTTDCNHRASCMPSLSLPVLRPLFSHILFTWRASPCWMCCLFFVLEWNFHCPRILTSFLRRDVLFADCAERPPLIWIFSWWPLSYDPNYTKH